jgi:hypothetical protein
MECIFLETFVIDDTSSLIMRKSTEHILLVNLLRNNWVGDIGPILSNGMLQAARMCFGVGTR